MKKKLQAWSCNYFFFFANAVKGREIMMKSIGFTDCKWPNEHAEMTEDEPGIVLPLGGTNVNNYLFTPDIDSEKE